MKTDAADIKRAIEKLASSKEISQSALWKAYDDALAKNEGDDFRAIEQFSASSEWKSVASELSRLHKALGEKGYEEVLATLREKGTLR